MMFLSQVKQRENYYHLRATNQLVSLWELVVIPIVDQHVPLNVMGQEQMIVERLKHVAAVVLLRHVTQDHVYVQLPIHVKIPLVQML